MSTPQIPDCNYKVGRDSKGRCVLEIGSGTSMILALPEGEVVQLIRMLASTLEFFDVNVNRKPD